MPNQLLRIAQGLPVEEAEGQRALQGIPHLHVLKQVVGNEIGHIAAHGDLKEGVLAPGLEGSGGDGVGAGEDARADVEAEVHVLAGLEHRDVPVGRLKAEHAGGGRGFPDIHDLEGHVLGMQQIRHFADGILGIGDGRALGEVFLSELGDAGSAAHVLQKAFDLDAHFAAASFFFSMASSTPLAAARPLVTAGPMPLPDMPWAPANSRPSMK